MEKAEVIKIVLGEAFPLFTGNLYKLMKYEVEGDDALRESINSVTHILVTDFKFIIAKFLFGLQISSEEEESERITFDDYHQICIEAYVSDAFIFYNELQGLAKYQIEGKHSDAIRTHLAKKEEKLKRVASKHDLRAFFNEPQAEADWEYWNARVCWTPSEAVALSFGKDPRKVHECNLQELKPLAGSPFRDEFLDRLDRLNRSIAAKLIKIPLQKASLLKWAHLNNIEFPNAMAFQHKDTSNGKFNGHKLHTFYEVILGIAIGDYGYDVLLLRDDAQTAVVDKVRQKLASVGHKISNKTLIRLLRDAKAWAHSETSHPLIVHARKAAAADERRLVIAEGQKVQTKVLS